MSRLLHFDAFSGIAGDMALAALLDAGASEAAVRRGLAKLPLDPYELHLRRRDVSSISALDVQVQVPDGDDGQGHGHRHWSEIRAWIEEAGLPDGARDRALAIFSRLAEAEAEVHGAPVDEVAFHEVGAVDSIVDIVGVALAIDDLAPDRVSVSPLPVGRGFVKTAHGAMPLPAPATSLLLKGLRTRSSGLDVELVTPTGAAIVAALADEVVQWPDFAPSAVGWGAGDRELADRPNLLRVVVGETVATGATETVVELHANIDDMTGEQHAYLAERLWAAGALDVWLTPIHMKKGRPAVLVAALCDPLQAGQLEAILLTESTSLGVRTLRKQRRYLQRRLHTVDTQFGPITVKMALGPDQESLRFSPEHEDCAAAAREHNVPLMRVTEAARSAAEAIQAPPPAEEETRT